MIIVLRIINKYILCFSQEYAVMQRHTNVIDNDNTYCREKDYNYYCISAYWIKKMKEDTLFSYRLCIIWIAATRTSCATVQLFTARTIRIGEARDQYHHHSFVTIC